jgi:hypothetical protein
MVMSNTSNLQMNLMWTLMGVMVVMEFFMFYIHAKMHKRIAKLEEELRLEKQK